MKLKTQLLFVSSISIGVILVFLIISYMRMFLSNEAVYILTIVTAAAGVISIFAHALLTRPIEKALHKITAKTKDIAKGDFTGRVPEEGPIEFRQLAKNINEMNKQLEESFSQIKRSEASRRELVANISHDLRTPLASIQSFVEALQDGIVDDPKTYDRYLETIKLESNRISYLINDLFQLSELDSGQENFEPDAYHLDSLIVETLQHLAIQLEEKQIDVEVLMSDHLPAVSVMPEKMKRVFVNILENAIRFSDKNSKIVIQTSRENDTFLKVNISDQGQGISDENQKHVFERFYRVEKSRNPSHGGAGLGLSIAKTIVERHGGEIGIESRLNEGSTFWITLPIYRNDEG
ncbi:sensor histidine kinase [Pseudalkalibacillus berkeleyi]|uniref:histidine kinase n=1 Tax=Pseudalkalibacillus berkeleyi TaxID=1069813 RepID=A0ABS9GXP7_9BACL|nr:HAMP domain-containing sensor histidine kinase [Pseudalkalibacillus berkeleyi]MCF6136385.1 cell wall metabolism sensor histidine kinase WalK [Pseudalkalibacillus berkeleyi]